MLWQSVSKRSSGLPFSVASGSTGRVKLVDRLGNRPVIAATPLSPEDTSDSLDAGLNGMTRSLSRRISGLNVPVATRSTD